MRELDPKGNMPFAMIAVLLLLTSVALGGVIYRYNDSDTSVDRIENDMIAMDEAVADVTSYVNSGLGGIVRGLSTASDNVTCKHDTMVERERKFRNLSSDWMEFQFPIRCGGAVVEAKGFDIKLVADPSQFASEKGDGGFSPTYLKGKGTIDVRISTSKCNVDTQLDISTDGCYALPLSSERLELFKSMAGGNGVSVSQMISYQLTGLAQYRTLNGYGATSAYGPRGTTSIITESDVRNAYNYAVEAVSLMCFHNGSGLLERSDTDLAEIIAAKDGNIELDLSSVYAQCLLSVIDDIALRWMDYLYGFEILEVIDDMLHPYRGATDSLKAFIFGSEKVYSAVPYIEKTMELTDAPGSCRYPGSGSTTLSYGGITVSVQNPARDLYDATWLKDFGKRYASSETHVRGFVIDVLKRAALIISERTDLGTVSIEVDPHDEGSFVTALTDLFRSAIGDIESAIVSAIPLSLSSTPMYDPYLGAICDEILVHSGEFVMTDSVRTELLSSFASAIPKDSEVTVESMIASGTLDSALRQYESGVRSDLSEFEALRMRETGNNVIRAVLAEICAIGMSMTDILSSIPGMANTMCNEIASVMTMNPEEGTIRIPTDSDFRLDDGKGNISVERIVPTIVSSLIVESVTLNESKCTHTVGFHENPGAAYTTVFEICMNDVLDVSLTGISTIAQSMGTYSSLLEERVQSSYVMEISIISGWELAGVSYKPSTTVLEDIWKVLLELLEPIIEPLRRIMESVRNVMTCISEYLIEALSFIADKVMAIYQAVIDPLGTLKEWFETAVEDIFSQASLDILVSIGMGSQKVTFEFFGCVLEFATKAITWNAKTKTLLSATLTMPVSGLTVSAGITAKVRGDVKKENLIITGFGAVAGDDWSLKVNLDPLMKGSRHLITINGDVRGTDISIVAPKLENYQNLGLTLSDVPGIGKVISNIPVMGVNVGLDAGFNLKYDNPQKTGLIINEFESNPKGSDKGNEYIELYNNSLHEIDLTGYTLMAASDRKSKNMELTGSISPGEHLLIYPKFTLVNSSGKHTKNGEAVILHDSDGNEVDKTPTRKDTSDDEYTWQRAFDGSTEWVFAKGTPGRTNNTYPLSNLVSAEELKGIAWKAVEKSFDKVDTIHDLETLQEFMRYLIRYTLEGVINEVSGQLIEASVFASIDIKDATSSASAGIKVALRTDGDMVKDVMKYLVGKVMEIVLNTKNPYRISPVGMFTENIDLEVSFNVSAGFPEILSKGADLPNMKAGLVFRTNLAGLTRVIGTDTGRPEVMFGLRIEDCPREAIPSKLSPKKNMDHDLWLMMVSVRFPRS